MHTIRTIHCLLAGALVLAACGGGDEGSTPGMEGRVHFAFTSGPGCEAGCALDRAMMIGTTERIALDERSGLPSLVAESASPEVFEVTSYRTAMCCEGSSCRVLPEGAGESCNEGRLRVSHAFDVAARATGEADLVLRDEAGDVFDRVGLRVRAPEGIALAVGRDRAELDVNVLESTETLELTGGAERLVEVYVRDGAGARLQASSGILLRTEDPGVAAFPFGFGDTGHLPISLGPRATLGARGPGETTLAIQAGSLHQEVSVRVD